MTHTCKGVCLRYDVVKSAWLVKEKEIDLNGDTKRLWFEKIKNLDTIQNSECLDVDLI